VIGTSKNHSKMKLKKFFLYTLTGVILFVDYSALDDITTGKEPSYLAEYLTLTASIVILFIILKYGFKKIN
jgi:membrane protein DedA with SNARE-associated domain